MCFHGGQPALICKFVLQTLGKFVQVKDDPGYLFLPAKVSDEMVTIFVE
jgi:hypothetical protein